MLLTLNSGNEKLGKGCATTYAPIRNTCPTSCPLMGGGCYAQAGHTAIHLARLEGSLAGVGPEVMAELEASEIRDAVASGKVPQGTPLRLHTFGDCRTPEAAKRLGEACRLWPGPVWTYTHAWRDVPRAAWGDAPNLSVVASLDSVDDVHAANLAGYDMTSLVVAKHTGPKAYAADGTRVVPCPNQTLGKTCRECRLCFGEHAMTIAFEAHGAGAGKAKRRLGLVAS
jgi:hypothetical protein